MAKKTKAQIEKELAEVDIEIIGEGVIEILQDGFGFF